MNMHLLPVNIPPYITHVLRRGGNAVWVAWTVGLRLVGFVSGAPVTAAGLKPKLEISGAVGRLEWRRGRRHGQRCRGHGKTRFHGRTGGHRRTRSRGRVRACGRVRGCRRARGHGGTRGEWSLSWNPVDWDGENHAVIFTQIIIIVSKFCHHKSILWLC